MSCLYHFNPLPYLLNLCKCSNLLIVIDFETHKNHICHHCCQTTSISVCFSMTSNTAKQFIQPTFMIHIWSLTASNLWKVNIFSTIQIWNYMRASKQFNFWVNCPFPVFKTLCTFYSVKLNNNTCQIVLVWMSERHSRNEQDWLNVYAWNCHRGISLQKEDRHDRMIIIA